MKESNEPEIDTDVPPRAVSVLASDGGMDEFPVLKAFQQYIDAEQTKARKRIMMLCGIFGALIVILIVSFAFILIGIQNENQNATNEWQQRNQVLNDRLVEFVMKDRERSAGAPVVVQPTTLDNSALLAVTAQLEELRKKMEAAPTKTVAAAVPPAAPDPQAEQMKAQLALEKEKLELERAKMAAEKEKLSLEKAKKREADLDAYRRRRWPELYAPQNEQAKPEARKTPKKSVPAEDVDAEIDEILSRMEDANQPISYFEEEDESEQPPPSRKIKSKKTESRPYTIPVETIKTQPGSRWRIPTK